MSLTTSIAPSDLKLGPPQKITGQSGMGFEKCSTEFRWSNDSCMSNGEVKITLCIWPKAARRLHKNKNQVCQPIGDVRMTCTSKLYLTKTMYQQVMIMLRFSLLNCAGRRARQSEKRFATEHFCLFRICYSVSRISRLGNHYTYKSLTQVNLPRYLERCMIHSSLTRRNLSLVLLLT